MLFVLNGILLLHNTLYYESYLQCLGFCMPDRVIKVDGNEYAMQRKPNLTSVAIILFNFFFNIPKELLLQVAYEQLDK